MNNIVPIPPQKRTEKYWQLLNQVKDPELDLGIVDLGLVYDISISKKGIALVTMTLTTPYCPVAPYIIEETEKAMRKYKGVKEAKVNIVWDPIWTPDMINEDVRDLLI